MFCYCYFFDSVHQACDFVLLPHFADSLVGGSENTVSDMFIYVLHLGRHRDKQQRCIFQADFLCCLSAPYYEVVEFTAFLVISERLMIPQHINYNL